MRCATATLVAPVLSESALRLLVLLVPVILDHVLGTVHVAAQRGPAVAMLSDPSHEALTLLGSDLVPVQARLKVVVPPLAALLCVSGTVLAGDLDPMDLVLVATSVDQGLESFVLLGGPRPSLLAWAAGGCISDGVACHDDALCMGLVVVMIKKVTMRLGHASLLWGGRFVGSSKVVGALKALWALTLLLTQDPKTVVVDNSPTCEKEMCCRDS